MKKIAMLAVVFAFSLAAVGCGTTVSTSKTNNSSTTTSEKK